MIKKRIVSALLSSAMVLSALGATAFAAPNNEVPEWSIKFLPEGLETWEIRGDDSICYGVGFCRTSETVEREKLNPGPEVFPLINVHTGVDTETLIVSGLVTNERLAELVLNGEIPKDVEGLLFMPLERCNHYYTPYFEDGGWKFKWHYSSLLSDISPLSELTNLKNVYMIGSMVTDLSPLKSLKMLESVDVRNTPVPSWEVSAIKAALPNVIVYSNHALSKIDILSTNDALEILKSVVGLPSVFDDLTSVRGMFLRLVIESDKPTTADALEVLKIMVGLPSVVTG